MLEAFSINCPFQSIAREFLSAAWAKKLLVHPYILILIELQRIFLWVFVLQNQFCFFYYPCVLQKWSKGKQKEKVNNMVLFDQATYDKLLVEVPKYKLITPSILSDRLRVSICSQHFIHWMDYLMYFLKISSLCHELFYRLMDLWPGKQSGTWCPRELSDL